MARDLPTPPLFFVHIMKTAGTTFRQLVREQFDERDVFPSRHYDQDLHHAHTSVEYLAAIPATRRARIRAYMGHFPYVATELLEQDLFTITILRDPIDRTISHLKHLKLYSPAHRHSSFEAIYDDPMLRMLYLQNHQTKIFAATAADLSMKPSDFADVDGNQLELAKRNLDRVDLVGFVERYDEFLDAVEGRFGWRLGRSRHRRAGPAGDVSTALRRTIEADNRSDIDFYDYARRRR